MYLSQRLTFPLFIGLLLAVVPFAQAEVKIATVDLQTALQTVNAGKTARSNLEKEFNKKKEELQKEEAEIKKMHEEFQKQSMVMNEQARIKKQSELQQRILKFQEKTAQSQMSIQKKEQELTQPIIEKLKNLVNEVAQKKGYTHVLEKSSNGVILSPKQDDLTDEIVKTFNAKKG